MRYKYLTRILGFFVCTFGPNLLDVVRTFFSRSAVPKAPKVRCHIISNRDDEALCSEKFILGVAPSDPDHECGQRQRSGWIAQRRARRKLVEYRSAGQAVDPCDDAVPLVVAAIVDGRSGTNGSHQITCQNF